MREALLATAVLNAVMIVSSVAFFCIPVLAPEIAADLGVNPTLVGAYSAIIWACSLVASFGSGSLLARTSPMRVSQWCIALCGLGLVFAGHGTVASFVVAAVLIGLAHGVETPASSQLLARLAPPRHLALVFSLKQTGVQIGGMSSGIVLPLLLGPFGWRMVLWIIAFGLFVCAWSLRWPRRRFDRDDPAVLAPRAPKSMMQALRTVYADRTLFRLTFSALGYVSAQVCFNTFLVSFLVRERELTLAVAGMILTVGQFGGLIGRVLWGALSGRLIRAIPLLLGLGVIMTMGYATLGGFGQVLPVPALYLASFLIGLTVSGWNGVYLAEIARHAPRDEVGRITAASLVLSGVGLIAGPLLFASIAGAANIATGYLFAAAWIAGGVACLAWPARRTDRHR